MSSSTPFLLTSGNDQFTIAPDLQRDVLALEGDDLVIGSSASDTIIGNQGNDTLQGLGSADRVLGGQDFDSIGGDEGNDTLNGNKGPDFVNGGTGDDLIRGGQDPDLLIGNEGSDSIFGDRGTDFLTGNGRSDLFALSFISSEPDPFGLEADAILDFQGAEGDRIGLPNGLIETDLFLTPFSLEIDTLLSDDLLEAIADAQDLGFPLDQLRTLLTPATLRQAFQQFTGVDVDPNGDGIVEGTTIVLEATEQIIGRAVNVTANDLAGGFISLSPEALALG
ncbi:MAG: calcium-binding protein [Microcoleaceae cyanobacterium]